MANPSPAPTPSKRSTRSSRSQRDKNSDRESERDRDRDWERDAAKARKKRERAEELRREKDRREREREQAESAAAEAVARTQHQQQLQEFDREREGEQHWQRGIVGRGRERTIRPRAERRTSRIDLSPVSVSSNSTITPSSFATTGPRAPPMPPPKDGTPGSTTSSLHPRHHHHGPPALVPVSTIIHPRVAVVLGIPRKWHFVLFLGRLLSIAPACYWGLPRVAGVLIRLGALWVSELQGIGMATSGGTVDRMVLRLVLDRAERRALFTEVALALIWVFASAYLSFFFTDCLMSRWLVKYTPQATVIRLISISALNTYITSWVLYLGGGLEDPRLLLPAWISIATTLTIMYHITQRKINIRKETSASISVFSIASFISMVSLLIQLQLARTDFPTIPLIELSKQAWAEAGRLAVRVLQSTGNQNGMGV
ncbi:hypothetical protein MKZ38_009456 [Zalerion maritima]|uniref:N-glycosylation protein EOS1 n=1 Tax=Zalerion maritima TaxID=339359 RepID=A0AAD5RT96_9PEZI|nr:hypothetical protein MKZ38_009456 [Zalerion maritima]